MNFEADIAVRRPYRAWINQPSTHQPFHMYHGSNVIAVEEPHGHVTAYFAANTPAISIRVPRHALSEGWKK